MSFQSGSEYNRAPGSYNSSSQQYLMNPQPSVGRFPTEAPTFYAKGSTGAPSAVPAIVKSMAPQSTQGNLQDQSAADTSSSSSSSANQHRFHGPGAKGPAPGREECVTAAPLGES